MLKINNSLTRTIEDFVPINGKKVGMYTCGPTVYDYLTIGNWRTYTLGDIVLRTLKYLGYEVNYVMNITDVGHLTGDNDGDASTGEDRMAKASRRTGKNAWEVAKFYTEDFVAGFAKLNVIAPDKLVKATDHIAEQIAMIEQLQAKGLTYLIDDGVYFDVAAYEKLGSKYGELSNLDQIKEGARVEVNVQKRSARDFALWKFAEDGVKRDMEWESPWGKGFPGWHIECSAMSVKYLGNQFELHLGGEDLRSTHHPNEIAQSEGATGAHPFVKYWLHGAHLQIDGGRMGKSLGNAFTLQDIAGKGYELLALRYFYMGAHYRKKLNFTFDGLTAAQNALQKLRSLAQGWLASASEGEISEVWRAKFTKALEDDFNMPQALAIVWEMTKSDLSDGQKLATLKAFDAVLGFDVTTNTAQKTELSDEVKELLQKRADARTNKDWSTSDQIRDQLLAEYSLVVKDGPNGQEVNKKQ